MNKKTFVTGVIFFILAIIFSFLVTVIDVQFSDINNANLGFATLNSNVFNLLGENSFFDKLSDVLLYFAILLAFIYAVKGLIELIQKKSLKKVNRNIIALGILFAITILTYLVFEKLNLNYSPILEDGALKVSYPSSHIMSGLVIFGGVYLLNKDYITKGNLKKYNLLFIILFALLLIARVLSGAHFITDIIGSLFFVIAYLLMFKAFIKNKD